MNVWPTTTLPPRRRQRPGCRAFSLAEVWVATVLLTALTLTTTTMVASLQLSLRRTGDLLDRLDQLDGFLRSGQWSRAEVLVWSDTAHPAGHVREARVLAADGAVLLQRSALRPGPPPSAPSPP